MKAKYICIEGVEGVGKTTQVNKLLEFLNSKGYKTLHTKEPGMLNLKETMFLRNLILNKDIENNYLFVLSNLNTFLSKFYLNPSQKKMLNLVINEIQNKKEYSLFARETLIQLVRSITLEYILNNMNNYDYIIQDRGILSGISYGTIVGNDFDFLLNSNNKLATESSLSKNGIMGLYDQVIYLKGNSKKGLDRAVLKNEFEKGDVMESKGYEFIEKVSLEFDKNIKLFQNYNIIVVDGLSINEVFDKIINKIP